MMRAKIRAAAALLPPDGELVQFDALGRMRAPFTLEPLPMFKLEIETGNAAFDDDAGPELARILRELADRLSPGLPSGEGGAPLRDINGNKVGAWSLSQ